MAYFLKQARLKGRTYLSIVESFYHPEKKGTAHRTFKSLASVESWLEQGIEDPVEYFQKEVDELNVVKSKDKVRKISDKSPEVLLGYFPAKSIMEKLKIKKYVDYFKLSASFRFDLYELLSSLVYARSVHPCSKSRTFHDVLPSLDMPYGFSYEQMLDGLSFLGQEYEKFVEIFTVQTRQTFGLNTSNTYFDSTNFYFEIDREDDFRRKGPSKENRKEPIVGLGILLDSNQLPIGMKMFPGNESEKPVLRDIVKRLKDQNMIVGKTIHVADKGINCAQNIAFSKKNGDGYLFSKSVKSLPEIEKEWVLLDSGYKEAKDKDGKLMYRYKSCIDKFPYTVEHEGVNVQVMLTEKRLVTYNPSLAEKKRYEINRLVEKAKEMTASMARKCEYGEAGKYISMKGADGKNPDVSINRDAAEKDLMLAGYNMLVTSEIKMKEQDMYDTYHCLWRIEESFRIMKSDLDARPVFLQKEECIKGHFLICYIAVLLERLFQFNVLENIYPATQIFDFMKGFRLVKADSKYINITRSSAFIKELSDKLGLPLENCYLTQRQVKGIQDCKL